MFGIAIPAPTPYDLKFSLLGIPVRVHPLFWLVAAFLGWKSHDRFEVFVWIACVFISIVVHEFGHGLTARWLSRQRPSVILYVMGGLCSYDAEDRRPRNRAAVLLMGPGAGFLLYGLVLGLGLAVLGVARVWPLGLIRIHDVPSWFMSLPEWAYVSTLVAYDDLLRINLFWGLFNLLPIYPLDGGQLAHLALTEHNRREGPSRSYILGILTAGGIAIYFVSQESWINAFLVANLAFLNYQLLQAAHDRRKAGYSDDDDDQWWRR